MQYLLPPIGCEQYTSFKAPGHEQVNADSDGLFRVENTALAEILVYNYGFRKASDETIATTSSAPLIGTAQTSKVDEGDEDEEEDFESMSDDELKAWLDERDVGYAKKAKRPQLLKLCEEAAEEESEKDEEDED